jgi:hypothetical protein
MRLWLVLAAMLSLLDACGPSRPTLERPHFVCVVHNLTTSPESMTVRWALGGVYVGEAKRSIPAGSDGVVVMGELPPDLVELDSLALTTAWGPPDYRAGLVFHVSYPNGITWTTER